MYFRIFSYIIDNKKGGFFMTLKEVSEKLGLNENTIRLHFPRTRDTLLKKGIVLIKEGRGDKAVYKIDYLFLGSSRFSKHRIY